jgi:hypothetical protein
MRAELSRGPLSAEEEVERVLHYVKDITLSRRTRILGRYPLRAVHDILRLNIDACLPRLGEPTRQLSVLDDDLKVRNVQFAKVYYLDVALAYSRQAHGGVEVDRALDYFRLVLDKNGLIRVEALT